ncbi:FAD/NAD(P)-binding domain-containing protein [Durotheca rogersii]|uniref:FAD/NAD(P)-binding domain-containing protein n=1 Tax=Durotheca rogersii TaxID=419775 RepID=UPI0022209B36|nr:FAD/NAD(P)-binding domain-containing protein [Durotheca rogersii]KAI5859575.1 FAD/NAD(P)-binding domain-containing protein [Durotheca rogersii]
MVKRVCVVGAGPSGLVAAKTLLHDAPPGSFQVTVFEAQSRVGGLWPTREDDVGGLVHPFMTTNQSKHSVQFSDLAWRDPSLEFPKAWQVGQYLERYLGEYGGADVRLGHKVVRADLQGDGSWEVQVESTGGSETNLFDYLLVATGFFGRPTWPTHIAREAGVPVIHSSQYRDIKTLLPNPHRSGHKILVVGGQMSGVEIAATIATDVSSATNSPGPKVIEEHEALSIHHIIHRPSWVFPLLTSPKPAASAPPFLPCDLPSYNLTSRPHPLKNSQGHITVDAATGLNNTYQFVLGSDQSEFSPELGIHGDQLHEQPFLAMSSWYMEFVRLGLIKIRKGKLSSFAGTVATLSPSNEEISDVAAVVLATGFDPNPSLSFLPPSVLEAIAYSPAHPNLPVALAFHGTHCPSLPTLGFVGFYRSPYWGVMEMQARFIARLWTQARTSQPPEFQQALSSDDTIARTLALRADPRVSQFPMGDYAFLMQEFARALDIPISPFGVIPIIVSDKPMNILTPARYATAKQSSSPRQKAEIEANLSATHDTAMAGIYQARFVAGAVFRSLLGEWRLERDLVSRLPSHPSGRFVGTARFLLRAGTADGQPLAPALSSAGACAGGNYSGTTAQKQVPAWGLEYLYVEDGTFTARDNPSLSFRATRRYVWRYDEARDKLSVWFTQTDDPLRADYLFHEVEFLAPSAVDPGTEAGGDGRPGPDGRAEDKTGGWQAKASHLCVEDLYDVHYEFNFRAVNLREWKLGYTVKGPKKDYTIDGVYRR